MSDTFTFLRELPKSFQEIGAVIPSSRFLGKALARPVARANRPINILEVGPGTGPITRQILRFMGPDDRFLVCEVNERFIERLKRGLEKNPFYEKHIDRVKFFRGPVQELGALKLEGTFDAIVSSLPFSNFTPDLVQEILTLYRDLLAPHGSITFCEYVGLRRISSIVRPRSERARVKAVDRVVHDWCHNWSQYGHVEKEFTLFNVPPAITLELNKAVPPKSVMDTARS